MKLNRERITAALAFLVCITFGVYPLLRSQLGPSRSYPPIPGNPRKSVPEVLQIEPRLHLEDPGGRRNPFEFSTDWQQVSPAPMPPPPLFGARRPRPIFGFLSARAFGSSVTYQASLPAEVKSEEAETDGGATADGAEETGSAGASPPSGPGFMRRPAGPGGGR